MSKWGRRGVSLWICFHLLAAALSPNEFFYLRQHLMRTFGPYLNILALNVTWKFFAPNPAPAVYLEFDVTRKSEAGEIQRAKEQFPGFKNEFFFRQHYNRRIALKNLYWGYPDLLRKVFVPRLICSRYPDAINVAVASIAVGVPSLEEVANGRALNDIESARSVRFISDEVCLGDDRGEASP